VGEHGDPEPPSTPPPPTSKIRRPRRSRPRGRTIALKQITRAERARLAELYPIDDDIASEPRPQTRADCRNHEGPCPWVSCKHHLYLDINPVTGSIKLNFPDLEPWELAHTCALAVAEAGAHTLEQVGDITNLTRERVRQVESIGLAKLGAQARRHGLR
jgi:ABC-type transporter Mla MlaB component